MTGYEFGVVRVLGSGDLRDVAALQLTPRGTSAIASCGVIASTEFFRLLDRGQLYPKVRDDAIHRILKSHGWEPAGNQDLIMRKVQIDGSNIEFCWLNLDNVQVEKVGLLRREVYINQYVALKTTPDGWVTVLKGSPFRQTPTEGTVAQQKLVDDLVAQGWKRTSEEGLLWRETSEVARPVARDHTASSDPMEALRRLGELRQAGVLSDEEFQRKKTELLDRL